MDSRHNVQADSECNAHYFEQPQRMKDTNSQIVTGTHISNPEELQSDIKVLTLKLGRQEVSQ